MTHTDPSTADVRALSTTALIRRFAAYYRPHRRLFLLDFSSAVVSGVLELAFPIAVGILIHRLLPGRELGAGSCSPRSACSSSTCSIPG